MIKLKTYTHFDREGLNCDAFILLIPDGWNVTGGAYMAEPSFNAFSAGPKRKKS
jgi:hypothetical protein